MTTSAFRGLTVAEKIFHTLVWRPAIITGELALEGAVPFFNLPVIKQIEEGLLDKLSEWAFQNFVLLIDVTAIKFVNSEHQAAYDAASVKLKVFATDYGIDSDEFKKERAIEQAAFVKFVSFSGAG